MESSNDKNQSATWTNTTTSKPHSLQNCFHLSRVYFEIGESPSPYIFNCILNGLSSIAAILGNGVVLLAIWKVSSLNMPSKILLFSLALSDLAIGVIVQPLFVTVLVAKIRNVPPAPYCGPSISFIVVTSCLNMISLLTVATIGLDRFIALYLHLRYEELVTVKRVVLLVCGIWSTSVFFGTTWLWNYKVFDPYAVFSATIFVILITSFAYFKVYQVVRRHQVHIQAQMQVQARLQAQEEVQLATTEAQGKKSATTMLLVYCLLLLCYLPYICSELVINIIGDLNITRELVREFTFTLLFFNSSFNPVVYCWRFREIRVAVCDTARRVLQIFC